ncbi:hypothetical protein VKT23_009269 [Stygiomarasmius scandens]|uniref:Proteophosphoglycan ppg4 n=1 Tax=Marasmiellus scandens TaxID=2682957 RepID=A0ABR1JHH1_9AGAR
MSTQPIPNQTPSVRGRRPRPFPVTADENGNVVEYKPQRRPSDSRTRQIHERYESNVSSAPKVPVDERTRKIHERYQSSSTDDSQPRSTTPASFRTMDSDAKSVSATTSPTWISRKPNPSIKTTRTAQTVTERRPFNNHGMNNSTTTFTFGDNVGEKKEKGIGGRFKSTMSHLFRSRKEDAGILDRAGPAVEFVVLEKQKPKKLLNKLKKKKKEELPPPTGPPVLAFPFAYPGENTEGELDPNDYRYYKNLPDNISARIRSRTESETQPPSAYRTPRSRVPSDTSHSHSQRYTPKLTPMQHKNANASTTTLSQDPAPRSHKADSTKTASASQRPTAVRRVEYEVPRHVPHPSSVRPVPRARPSNNLAPPTTRYMRRRSRSFGGYRGQLDDLLRQNPGDEDEDDLDDVMTEARGVARMVGPRPGYF